ncbi:hypothetical protein A3715_02055 [Oleiphilus sp. HI0009]|uniref:alpha/beta fold hydrolase n=1 Tax=unclassified Oleiphilus TaxID=2631174 RepID=UPI0007C27C50|nr:MULTISPECIES: alpha/beta hydrolase [unclassified Oleiphilus]KZX76163.1 hypothetical protein A3715_02055 [Oleiphilus sp. HI0009]KZY63217.1 hypothetical protein A3738_12230 [Oleiphilus sp. HI0066]KZY70592.1 hypothetical protein A3739_06265 [Oleiphilus sp. HI0067]
MSSIIELAPPTTRTTVIVGLKIRYDYREGTGKPIVFLHATGFNKAVWYEVVKHLENPVYLFDTPGHGQSEHPNDEFQWDRTAHWLAEIIDTLGIKNALGVGHSMGGQLMLSIAHDHPAAFDQLLLLDPVVLHENALQFLQSMTDHPVARRRNEWESSEELNEVFSGKAPFISWDQQVLIDYCNQALKPVAKDSGYSLACTPSLEACVYRNLGSDLLLDKIRDINTSTQIIRARAKRKDDHPLSFEFSPTRDDLVELLPNATDEQLTDWNHFFPMEKPEWLARRIKELLGSH